MSKSAKRKRASAGGAETRRSTARDASERSPRGVRAQSVSRLEIMLVVLVLAGGVLLRVAWPERMAVEHFDEGVYASNLWFDVQAGGYPARHLYAPPLVPALIEGSLLGEQVLAGAVRQPSGLAAMFPNLLAGCSTLLIVWWVMRTWFDPRAAIGATTLATGNEFHALYTRTALTDAQLLPWMLLAVFLFERALVTRRWPLLLLAGLACGLAWWTKYNGWLPLLIGLGGIVLRLAFVKAAWQSVARDLAYWAGFAAVAGAVWSPCLWSLQATGGYAEVMANHRGYIVGLTGWPASFATQLANLTHFEGWVSCLAPAAGLWLVWICQQGADRVEAEPTPWVRSTFCAVGTVAVAAVAVAAWFGLTVVLSIMAVAGVLATALRLRQQANRDGTPGGLAIWLVAAWFAGLFVLTPLYTPYPRLTLPWLCASWLASGLGLTTAVSLMSHRTPDGSTTHHTPRRSTVGWALIVLLVVSIAATLYAGPQVTFRGLPAWQDRSGLRGAASSIKANIDSDREIVFVQGEPGLFYELRAAGVDAAPGFDFQRTPASLPAGVVAYLATGLHAQRSEEFQAQLSGAAAHLEEVATIPYQPSDLVLLNNFPPSDLVRARRAAWRVRLYRLK